MKIKIFSYFVDNEYDPKRDDYCDFVCLKDSIIDWETVTETEYNELQSLITENNKFSNIHYIIFVDREKATLPHLYDSVNKFRESIKLEKEKKLMAERKRQEELEKKRAEKEVKKIENKRKKLEKLKQELGEE